MKQTLLQIGAACSLAFLLAGCCLPQRPSRPHPTASPTLSEPPALPTGGQSNLTLDDQLRILPASGAVPAVVFYGSTPIYTAAPAVDFPAAPTGNVRILTDPADGSTQYVCAFVPTVDEAPYYIILDQTGRQIYNCGNDVPVQLCAGWLMLRVGAAAAPYGWEENTPARLYHLETGRTCSLPDGFTRFDALDESTLTLTTYTHSNRETFYTTTFFDRELQQIAILPGYEVSDYGRSGDWIYAVAYDGDTALYNLRSGALLDDLCGLPWEGTAVFKKDGLYQVVKLQNGKILAEDTHPILRYFDGNLLLRADDGSLCVRWADGDLWQNIAYHQGDALSIFSADQVACYSPEGTRWRARMEWPPNASENFSVQATGSDTLVVSIPLSGGGCCGQIYDRMGLVWQSTAYDSIYVPPACDYLICTRMQADTPIQDVRAADGSLLLADLVCEPDVDRLLLHLPYESDHCEPTFFLAQFDGYQGWMDLNGNWVYKRKIASPERTT